MTVHSQGPYYPQTVTQGTDSTWSNLANIQTSDGNFASRSALIDNTNSWCPIIYAKNFGFSIPSGATIVGILCEYNRKCNIATATRKTILIHAYAAKADGTYSTTNMADDGVRWPATAATVSLGSSSNLWGESWTAADINDPDFGISFTGYQLSTDTSMTVISYVDFIRFTVYYTNPAPTAPTGLTRASYEATVAADFTWTFNDAYAGDSQTAYQLLIYDVSDSSLDYDSGKITSAVSLLTLPANTLVNGKQYQWKVLTYDEEDQASPYSSLATFYTSAKPTAAITTPATDGATVATASLALGWSYTDPESEAQGYYQAILKDSLGGTLEDSTKTAGAGTSHTFSYALENRASYSVDLILWDAKGIASTTVTRTFICTYTPPATPTIAATTDNTRGSITLTITNPAPTGGQPALSYNEVWRKKSTETTYIRIATAIVSGGTFTDYTPASGVTYNYKVRAIGTNLGYADSAVSNQSITLTKPQIALTSDYSQYEILTIATARSEAPTYEKTMMQFAGRTAPVAEFGEHEEDVISIEAIITTSALWATLKALLTAKQTMLYRDERGRREFVTLGTSPKITDEKPNYYTVAFDLDRTSYSEVV